MLGFSKFICQNKKVLYNEVYFKNIFMASFTHEGVTYNFLDEIALRFPELVELLKNSQAINPEQKQYWLDIIPSMTNSQIDRLFNILITEKQEIERLDLAFQEEVKRLNEQHYLEYQALQAKKAKEKIAEAEKNDTSKQDAEDVLGQF